MDDAARGAAALAASNFALAIQHYTAALAIHPHAVDYYIKRSIAYTRTSPPQPLLALADAEVAVVLATRRGKRELLAQAQLRRAIALFGAERWLDAQRCVAWARALAPKEASLGIWEAKIDGKLAAAEGREGLMEAVVQEVPDISVDEIGVPKAEEKEAARSASGDGETAEKNEAKKNESKAEHGKQAQQAELNALPEYDKFRWDWYQSLDAVTVNLMMKRVPKTATLEMLPTCISLSFALPSGSTFDFSLDPLFARIDPTKSTAKIMSTKVEWILRKAVSGEKWKALEGDSTNDHEATADQTGVRSAVLSASTASTAPAYPTSSKSGPKNWDKLAHDLIKRSNAESKPDASPATADGASTAEEPPTSGGDGDGNDDDDDNDGGDPVNGFFKKLFRNADPDTRRAMMKSYQESNGTALSTNWDEVGKAPVETSPPDGMVARKWGE